MSVNVKSQQINCNSEYYKLLNNFVTQCEILVDKGQAYLAVILCHELFRFLYPVEPYANFVNTNPIEFIIKHIKILTNEAINFLNIFSPYQFDIDSFTDEKDNNTLEMETSELYSSLWKEFKNDTLTHESLELLNGRLPEDFINTSIVGKEILDMGCGSGRYTIAFAKIGVKHVTAIDLKSKSFYRAQKLCEENNYPVTFREGNVLDLPFQDQSFDFVFCNGVLHHTKSINKGISELTRVLKDSGSAFLYLYGTGGILWTTRLELRKVFKKIPLKYAQLVLKIIGIPPNRFFCDTWYVPIETHTSTEKLYEMLKKNNLQFTKIIGYNQFDLDKEIEKNHSYAKEMWGNGEHRYILRKTVINE